MRKQSARLILFGVAIIFISLSIASANELKSGPGNYTLMVPDGWSVSFQNEVGFSITSPKRNESITLLIQSAHFASLGENSIASFEGEVLRAGVEKISSRHFSMDGVTAYEIVYRVGRPPITSSTISRMILANGRLYVFAGCHVNGDVMQDSDLQQAINSFHFLKPPQTSRIFAFGKFAFLGFVAVITLLAGIIYRRARANKVLAYD